MNATDNSSHLKPLQSLEEPAKETERLIVGFFYIIVALAFLIPYAMVIHIIKQKKQMYDPTFYLLAVNMGFGDLVQLIFAGITPGLACIIPYPFPRPLQKFFGSLAGGGWFVYVSLSQSMAFNRLVTVYWPHRVQSMFTKKVIFTIIALCWIHGLAWTVVDLTPFVGFMFHVKTYSATIDMTLIGGSIALRLNTYLNWVHAASICVMYALIYVKVCLQKKQIVDLTIAANEKQERKVLLQSVLLCSMDVTVVAMYAILQMVPDSRWTNVADTLSWLISAGGNAFVYLAINKQIRSRFLEMCGILKEHNSL